MNLAVSALAVALLAIPAQAQEAEEPVTVDAFAVLEATGAVVETGPGGAVTFAGAISGPYFVDSGAGPIPAGEIICVGRVDAESATGRQTASASCRLMAEDGAVAYGGFTCEGFRLVGCVGPFTLTGGSGRLEGMIGEGPITLRRYETALAATGEGMGVESALGIASWKGFTLRRASQP